MLESKFPIELLINIDVARKTVNWKLASRLRHFLHKHRKITLIIQTNDMKIFKTCQLTKLK